MLTDKDAGLLLVLFGRLRLNYIPPRVGRLMGITTPRSNAASYVVRAFPRHCTTAVRWFAQSATDLVFPPTCVLCHGSLTVDPVEPPVQPEPPPQTDIAAGRTAQRKICPGCRVQLLGIPQSRCLRCGAVALTSGQQACRECHQQSFHFTGVYPLASYMAELREAVLLTKQSSHRIVARALAELLLEQRRDDLLSLQPDLIAAVPMYWSQRLRRGINAPEVVAEHLARGLGVPALPRLLVRHRNTEPQTNLPPESRFKNVRGAFRVSRRYKLNQARVLLVDDILTTGATCSETARVLRDAGAAEVFVTVLAKSTRPAT